MPQITVTNLCGAVLGAIATSVLKMPYWASAWCGRGVWWRPRGCSATLRPSRRPSTLSGDRGASRPESLTAIPPVDRGMAQGSSFRRDDRPCHSDKYERPCRAHELLSRQGTRVEAAAQNRTKRVSHHTNRDDCPVARLQHPSAEQPGCARSYCLRGFSKTAAGPSSASISRRRLYLAMRSLRQAEPVLIWPPPMATAKSARKVSSVSPDRCETT